MPINPLLVSIAHKIHCHNTILTDIILLKLYSENKDWPSSQQSPATAFTDLVPEFEPGKPWKVCIVAMLMLAFLFLIAPSLILM